MFGKNKRREEIQSVLNEFGGQLIDSLKLTVADIAEVDTEYSLAREDADWLKLSSDSGLDLNPSERANIVKGSRRYARHDSIGRQMVRLWTDYTIGKGVSWQAADDKASEILKAFWKDGLNKSVLSFAGQRKIVQRQLIDGELFFALFVFQGHVVIRMIDALQIEQIAYDPDDADVPRYYVRKWWNGKTQKQAIYPDWTNVDLQKGITSDGVVINKPSDAVEYSRIGDRQTKQSSNLPLIFHFPFEPLGYRGTPLLISSTDWIKAHRDFMRARVSWVMAQSRYANKVKVKGGEKTVDAMVAKIQSALVNGDSETNPPDAPGSTWVENQGVDQSPIKFDSGAKDAKDAANLFLQMAGLGGSIFPHYLGAGDAFRLATASAMELPMLKCFESYQMLWADTFEAICDFVLIVNGIEDEERRFIDFDMPEIIAEDSAQKLTAITQVMMSFPQFTYSPEVQKMVLMLMGLNNADEVLKTLSDKMLSESNTNTELIKTLSEIKRRLTNETDGKLKETLSKIAL